MGALTTAVLPNLAIDFGKYGAFGDRAGFRLVDWGSFALNLEPIFG